MIDTDNVKHLKSFGTMLYLALDYDTHRARLLQLDNPPRFIDKNYLLSRDEIYNHIADNTINITNQSVEEIILSIHQYQHQCEVPHGQ